MLTCILLFIQKNYTLILMMNCLRIIGANFGYGAQIRETQTGPDFVYSKLPKYLQSNYISLKSDPKYGIPAIGKPSLPAIVDFCSRLAFTTENAIKAREFPIILGGDHSIAAGSWAGIINALMAPEEFGLIWIDAHMDSHTYETSPSKAYHGMPLAALLGHGDPEFSKIAGIPYKLNPKHVTVVGVRSYEPEEQSLLEKLGVQVFYANDIYTNGLKSILSNAMDISSRAKGGFGITLDLDFFDPLYAPGVGSPERGGFAPSEFLDILPLLCTSSLKAFEIVELNPARDIDGKTVDIAVEIIKAIDNIKGS
jgi:arginase